MKRQKAERRRMIFRFLKGSYRYFLLAVMFSMLYTVFNSLTPQVIRAMVDSIIGTEPFQLPEPVIALIEQVGGREYIRSHLLWVVAAILLIALCAGVCTFFSRTATAVGAEGFTKRIREALFSHIQRLPYQWHVKNRTGDIIQRCTSDVEMVRNFVSGQMLEMVRIVFLLVFAMSLMFSMDAKLTWVALAFVPVVVLYSPKFPPASGRRTKRKGSFPPPYRKISPACGWSGRSGGNPTKSSGLTKKTTSLPICGFV